MVPPQKYMQVGQDLMPTCHGQPLGRAFVPPTARPRRALVPHLITSSSGSVVTCFTTGVPVTKLVGSVKGKVVGKLVSKVVGKPPDPLPDPGAWFDPWTAKVKLKKSDFRNYVLNQVEHES